MSFYRNSIKNKIVEMKKGKDVLKKSFILLLIFLLCISACEKEQKTIEDQDFISFKQSKYNDIPSHFKGEMIDIEMRVEPSLSDKKTKEISLFIKNNRGSINYGTPYELEVFKNGKWQKIPFRDDFGFIMIGIILKEGQTDKTKIGLDTKSLKYHVHSGYYRVVKEFTVGNGTEKKIKLSSIFQLK